jgi:hypothetical protein
MSFVEDFVQELASIGITEPTPQAIAQKHEDFDTIHNKAKETSKIGSAIFDTPPNTSERVQVVLKAVTNAVDLVLLARFRGLDSMVVSLSKVIVQQCNAVKEEGFPSEEDRAWFCEKADEQVARL